MVKFFIHTLKLDGHDFLIPYRHTGVLVIENDTFKSTRWKLRQFTRLEKEMIASGVIQSLFLTVITTSESSVWKLEGLVNIRLVLHYNPYLLWNQLLELIGTT